MGNYDNIKSHDRMSFLMAQRNRKMASSVQAYVRGSTKKFYEWLQDSDRPELPEGPPVWICGDCHVGNLGPVSDVDGSIAIEVRDFDQTVIGNPAHDLIRLGLSLAMAARNSVLPGNVTARMLESLVTGYEKAFAVEARHETTDHINDMPKIIRMEMHRALGQSWKHLADKRIGGKSLIPIGKRFWTLTANEHAAVVGLFAEENVRNLTTSLRERTDNAETRVIDAAYWRKGCSSLGRLRLAVLMAAGHGKNERHCLIDVKEATAAAAPSHKAAEMPSDHAERVVSGARQMSPFLGPRMVAEHILGKAVFVRELFPQDLKLEIETLRRKEAMNVAEYLAHVVGRGHARQMPPGTSRHWLAELHRNHSKSLDAPSWLWNSVVDLVGVHEAAYLNHCRRYPNIDNPSA